MRIFISYKFRGVDGSNLKKKLKEISSILEKNGHQTILYFRDKENWQTRNFPPGKVIKEAFEEIRECDAVFAFIDHKETSEGMLLEIGYAKALNKKIILLISKKLPFPTLEAIADKVLKFSNSKDLNKKLENYRVTN